MWRAFIFVFCGIVSGQPPSRAPCIWLFKTDTNTRGGIPTNYSSLQECQTNCLGSNSCLRGLDWDPNNNIGVKCWFSNEAEIGSAPGVTHYYQSCAGSLTTNTPYSMPPFSITTNTGPYCQWHSMNNTNTKGGVLVPGANTVDECKMKCQQNTNCINGLGFDFNDYSTLDNKCFLSQSKQLYPTPGIIHYEPSSLCSTKTNESSALKSGSTILILFLLKETLLALIRW